MKENELDKYVSRNVRLVAVTITVASSIYFFALRPIQNLESEVSSIKTNHLTHIQGSLDRIEADLKNEKEDDKKRDEMLTRLEILLKSHTESD
jgi:hypothetical protein